MDVFIIGVHSTAFARHPEQGFRALAESACNGALADVGEPVGTLVEQVWFGNCAMDVWGQSNIRGQVSLTSLLKNGVLKERTPILNVEGGCATGSLAFHGAFKDIASGQSDVSLALGVEKTFVPDDPAKMFGLFTGGIDQMHPSEWKTFFNEAGERGGQRFEPHPHRIMFLDIHAMQARHHMATYGTTAEQFAHVASKNHSNGVHNPNAQYRTERSVEEILSERPVVDPFTRAMCAPISDGAAALVLCSGRFLSGLDKAVQERAVKVRSTALVGGAWRELGEPTVVHHAAEKAYKAAGISGADVDIAEVHDATAYCEINAYEALGFCPEGQGGAYAQSGETARTGTRPVNPSGGLIAKGHPLGATGVGMIQELVTQLRGEADAGQVTSQPTLGVQQNAGGLIGFDEALCSVSVLERVHSA